MKRQSNATCNNKQESTTTYRQAVSDMHIATVLGQHAAREEKTEKLRNGYWWLGQVTELQ